MDDIICDVNDWYEASRSIMDTYSKTIAKDWDDSHITKYSFNTPSEFTLLMQNTCIFSHGKDMEIEALKKEIEELYSEIEKLRGDHNDRES